MKIAIVYDRVNKMGGAERVLLALHEIWPQAPLYTSVYNPKTASWADTFEVKPSYLQYLPFATTHHEWFPWLMPTLFSSFNLNEYDVILTVTSAEAKCIKADGKRLHICYCLTPTRYLWSHKDFYEKLGIKGKILHLISPMLRMRDFEAAQEVDAFLAISQTVQQRILKYYRKDSTIIYPPVDIADYSDTIHPLNGKPYYLVVSRLVEYKRIDIAIEACKKLQRNIVVIGTGSDWARLNQLSYPGLTLCGHLTDSEMGRYYMHCQALLFPSEEDFGIVMAEALGFGKPVIAYAQGGSQDIVEHNRTGILVDQQSTESFVKAMECFESMKFKSWACKQSAHRFVKENFKKSIKEFVEKSWDNHQVKAA